MLLVNYKKRTTQIALSLDPGVMDRELHFEHGLLEWSKIIKVYIRCCALQIEPIGQGAHA